MIYEMPIRRISLKMYQMRAYHKVHGDKLYLDPLKQRSSLKIDPYLVLVSFKTLGFSIF